MLDARYWILEYSVFGYLMRDFRLAGLPVKPVEPVQIGIHPNFNPAISGSNGLNGLTPFLREHFEEVSNTVIGR
jgi:hypothetical protein